MRNCYVCEVREFAKKKIQTGSICFSVGQPIAVLSAMKMEMVVNAPVGGVVKAIRANKGDKLEGQDLLMEIE